MSSPEIFNRFYVAHPEKEISESLKSFFEKLIQGRLNNPKKILELGCGNYSLFEEVNLYGAEITAVDFSAVAIEQAPKSNIVYQERSLSDKNFFSEDEFDLVLDSHCMNCLVENSERILAFKNIFKVMKSGGLFAGEFMVHPIDKIIDLPMKRVMTSRELEEEILSHKFKIIYFKISREASFVNELNGEKILCDVLRLIAMK